MATFKQRLYNDVPGNDPDQNISAHAFEAAHVLFTAGKVTKAQVQAAFNMSEADWTATAAAIATNTIDGVNATVILRQEGYLTNAQADTILGL